MSTPDGTTAATLPSAAKMGAAWKSTHRISPCAEYGRAQRRDCHRDVDRTTIPGQAHRFERLDHLASLEIVDDVVLLLLPIGGNQTPNGLSNDFFFSVAEDALGAFIPAGDRPIERLGDD